MALLTTSPGLRFYREICRCVPFLIKQFELGELTDRHTLRRAVADRFLEHKHRTNDDAIEILIMKGRQELEEVMQRFKTRNHVLNTWVTDVNEKRRAAASAVPSGFTPFLDKFLVSNYEQPNVC